jgi:hypothetical protein
MLLMIENFDNFILYFLFCDIKSVIGYITNEISHIFQREITIFHHQNMFEKWIFKFTYWNQNMMYLGFTIRIV